MTDASTWGEIFDPLAAKHFTDTEMDHLKARPMEWDQAQVAAEWDALIAECKALMAIGDATSPQAMDLAGRWMAQVGKFTQGDPTLVAKVGAMWGEAMADPVAAPKLPLNPEMFAFIGKAQAARKALEA